MQKSRHSIIIPFVAVTIAITIGVQIYWNYVNYQSNKLELVNQVRTALDAAVETYYTDIAKGHTMTITASTDSTGGMKHVRKILSSEGGSLEDSSLAAGGFNIKGILSGELPDSVLQLEGGVWSSATAIKFDDGDSLNLNRIDTSAISMFASRIFVSMSSDEIDFERLASLLDQEFLLKNWELDYGLAFHIEPCKFAMADCDSIAVYGDVNQEDQLIATSGSSLIPGGDRLEIHFSNISSILLRQGLGSILLSLLLSAMIILCLVYLVKEANKQKQLVEIKNDLISNITHEFKTPITTIGTALEGIEKFGGADDPTKANRYLSMSQDQLGKLNTMVEKLLETASLESERIDLQKEEVDIHSMLERMVEQSQLAAENKRLELVADHGVASYHGDAFHLESAIGNLIDNALKYGGDLIKVTLSNQSNELEIEVIDNGKGIAKDQASMIFDKFYRVPMGNIHDVKGFGIGLYYAKNIIEKHGGALKLLPSTDQTHFKITLPYAD